MNLGADDWRLCGVRVFMKNRMNTIIALLGLCVSFATPAAGGALEDAASAFQRTDYATAMALWRPLAEQGNALAQFNLGVMYDKGDGVPQDYAAAVTWFRKAAAQGDVLAQHFLGLMYYQGEGVVQDLVQAHMWLNLAVSRSTAAERHSIPLVQDRAAIARRMTADQISMAQKLASEWKSQN
jgi:TPR repeat protein